MKKIFKIFMFAMLLVMAVGIEKVFAGDSSELQMAGLAAVSGPALNQFAEKEMIKNFRHDNTWLAELKSKNQWVNNDVIKIPKQGAAPTVLIDNNVYPVAKSKREDSHVVVSLHKYDTTNTIVTADELNALPYDKTSDVQQQHREELEDVTAQHALHSISPASHTATTPVLVATGAADASGRKKLTSKDIVALKKALDKLNVPKNGRVLVLCTDHVADLLDEDRTFQTQYQNAIDGVLSKNYYGFRTYESNYTPTYAATTNAKVAFGATAGPQVSSICFHSNTAVKATGSVQRFMRDASQDPENRENTIGFRLYFVAVAIKNEGIGAIIG
jgi:hypothetical protein